MRKLYLVMRRKYTQSLICDARYKFFSGKFCVNVLAILMNLFSDGEKRLLDANVRFPIEIPETAICHPEKWTAQFLSDHGENCFAGASINSVEI